MTDDVHITWRILVVDDEPDVCRSIARYLGREGFEVDTVANGDAMYAVLADTKIDLIVLDLRLPGKDGLTLARELRQSSTIPIIMLTAKDDVIDRVVGLESGADDYVPKPFHPRELLARIRAVLRRLISAQGQKISADAPLPLNFAGWCLNCDSRQLLSPQGLEVPLSPVEFDLLSIFLQHPNRVLSRDFLLDQTRGRTAMPFDRAIDVHISHLRKKLEKNPKNPRVIKTIRNAGYIFSVPVTR